MCPQSHSNLEPNHMSQLCPPFLNKTCWRANLMCTLFRATTQGQHSVISLGGFKKNRESVLYYLCSKLWPKILMVCRNFWNSWVVHSVLWETRKNDSHIWDVKNCFPCSRVFPLQWWKSAAKSHFTAAGPYLLCTTNSSSRPQKWWWSSPDVGGKVRAGCSYLQCLLLWPAVAEWLLWWKKKTVCSTSTHCRVLPHKRGLFTLI